MACLFVACCFSEPFDAVLLYRIRDSRHTTEHTENIVVNSIDTNLGSGNTGNSSRGEDQLQSSIVNSGEVACSGRLVFFRSQGEGIDVDTSVGGTGMVLEGLDNVKVGAFAFREAVLAVELQLGSDNGIFTPAVHVKSSFGKNEATSIGDTGASGSRSALGSKGRASSPGGGSGGIHSTGHLEETARHDEGIRTINTGITTEGMDSVGKSINGISVVEGLGTEGLVEGGTTFQRSAVIHVGIRLDNPDEFLAGVVEVELNLVGRRADRFITSELELFNQVFMGVLGELATFVSVQEDIVNVEGSSNKGLLVGSGRSLVSGGSSNVLDSPEALANRTEINVNLDFVVLYEPLIPLLSEYLSAFL